ncbi:terpenoid synthase [Lasiosphaeria hispida]|uniref:Terpene synthase n=1 Tax=Lasiosphaeria hispida TaxID=260671 RepID=A0AAJ0ML75_9PEZI|nr:terpenoid synthase [Lasiosphaeria hispida]
MAAEMVTIPDFLRNWPWKREINANYETAKAAAEAWVHTFNFFDSKSQNAFDRCELSKLSSLTYPYFDQAQLRAACELMTLFYLFDEYTDVSAPAATRALADVVMDALRNPSTPRPEGEFPLAELARQYWANTLPLASPMARRHLIDTFQAYVDSVVQQAEDRAGDRVRSVEEYWPVRRHTGGCLPSFALMELELDFGEEVYGHPLVVRLREIAMDSICATNDVYSYNVERARGHALHNLVTLIMHEKDIGPQAAVRYIGEWHDGIVAEFLACHEELKKVSPQWGAEVDRQVQFYVHGMGCWVRGSDNWHFEGQRHMGKDGLRIQRERVLAMMPRVEALLAREGDVALRELMEKNEVAGIQIETKPVRCLVA